MEYHVPRNPTYSDALDIARSKHPSRILANTLGYRYGRFEEGRDGEVTVTMMGSHIATFRPGGVQLWTCGYATASTTEALSALTSGVWFETAKGVVHARQYADPGPRRPFTEGAIYPYQQATT